MKHRLFTILSILSLVLCLGTTTICVRSYWSHDAIGWGSRTGTHGWLLGVEWRRGTVVIGVVSTDQADNLSIKHSGVFWRRLSPRDVFPQNSWSSRMGFFSVHETDSIRQSALGLPCWFVLLLAGVLPALWLRRFSPWGRRRFREQHGLCPTCGYDLRASLERCPECGRPIPADLVRSPVT